MSIIRITRQFNSKFKIQNSILQNEDRKVLRFGDMAGSEGAL